MTYATEIEIPIHPVQYRASQHQGQYHLYYNARQLQYLIFKIVKEQGITLKRRLTLVFDFDAELDFGLHCATQIGNRGEISNSPLLPICVAQ